MTRVQRTKHDSRAVTREYRLIPRIKLINRRVNGTRECKLTRELYSSTLTDFMHGSIQNSQPEQGYLYVSGDTMQWIDGT